MSLLQKVCPGGGFVTFLTSGHYNGPGYERQQLATRVSCRRWTCTVCATGNVNRFKRMVETGFSILGHCWFITLTFRLDGTRPVDAPYVSRAWHQFWRRMQAVYPCQWVKVVELTKKGQPHLHLVMGPFPPELRIRKLHGEVKAWWMEATGDSYVVWVEPIRSAEGAGKYLAKYFSKTFSDRDAMALLGFARRWSTSGAWPRSKLWLRLKPWGESVVPAEYRPVYDERAKALELASRGNRLLSIDGDDEALVLYRRSMDRRNRALAGAVVQVPKA